MFRLPVAPIGPHSQGASGPDWVPPLWAKRHDGLFEDAVAPRLSSFNPDEPSGVSWVSQLAKLNQTEVDFIDVYYRARLRALQANDELVAAVVKKVEELGLLDNTYIMMTSDNGFTLGAHRRHPGKTTGYEEDIRASLEKTHWSDTMAVGLTPIHAQVPFLVRGPGIEHGKDELSAHSNIDITATIVHLTGAEPQHELDGRIMPWANKGAKKTEVGTVDFALQEFWVAGGGEGKFSSSPNFTIPTNFAANANYPNNTYRMLRVIEENHNLAYAVWCQGSRELYDMQVGSALSSFLQTLSQQSPLRPLTFCSTPYHPYVCRRTNTRCTISSPTATKRVRTPHLGPTLRPAGLQPDWMRSCCTSSSAKESDAATLGRTSLPTATSPAWTRRWIQSTIRTLRGFLESGTTTASLASTSRTSFLTGQPTLPTLTTLWSETRLRRAEKWSEGSGTGQAWASGAETSVCSSSGSSEMRAG